MAKVKIVDVEAPEVAKAGEKFPVKATLKVTLDWMEKDALVKVYVTGPTQASNRYRFGEGSHRVSLLVPAPVKQGTYKWQVGAKVIETSSIPWRGKKDGEKTEDGYPVVERKCKVDVVIRRVEPHGCPKYKSTLGWVDVTLNVSSPQLPPQEKGGADCRINVKWKVTKGGAVVDSGSTSKKIRAARGDKILVSFSTKKGPYELDGGTLEVTVSMRFSYVDWTSVEGTYRLAKIVYKGTAKKQKYLSF